MSKGVRSTMSKIEAAVKLTADSYTNELYREIRKDAKKNQGIGTPVRDGRARRGWKIKEGRNGNAEIYNKVPYIGPLDEGSSPKAPNGIVKPAFKKIENKFGKTRRK